MYFIKDPDRKIAFGWSPKCACTSIKTYFRRLQGYPENKIFVDGVDFDLIKSPLARTFFRWLYNQRIWRGFYAKSGRKHWWDQQRQTSLITYYYKLLLVKIAWTFFQGTIKKFGEHTAGEFYWNPDFEHEAYTKILFIRNPYKRIVSGFLDKYTKLKPPHEKPEFKLEIDNLNFERFVEELDQNMFKNIDFHHFDRQTRAIYRPTMKFHKIYDIEDIDYEFIAELFGRNPKDFPLPQRRVTSYDTTFTGEAYKLTLDELRKIGDFPPYHLFYNEDIKAKVHRFYADDFELFEKHGFKYDIELT